MASVSTAKNGTRAVLVICPDGKRRRIRLGRATKAVAKEVKRHVEHLVSARTHGLALPPSTAEWMGGLTDRLRERLVVCGLADAADGAPSLGAWLKRYIEGRGDVARGTQIIYRQVEADLVEYFGADRALDAIGPGDAEDFSIWLRTKREPALSEGTARRRCGMARHFFRAAIKRRLLRENPFDADGVKTGKFTEARFHFVPTDTAQAIMDALPSPAWRLAFALARWGGLRVPSEVAALTWDDVSWDRGRFTVHARKTAKHEGKATRVVPIFLELEGPFREAFEAAEDGAVFCCPQYPESTANQHYRKVILRALATAGVKPWPKLFINLRATRATELVAKHPAHVAAAWLGHSPEIARKHYLSVTEADYERAQGAAQKAAQQAQEMPETPCNDYGKAGISDGCTPLHEELVEARGFEPLTSCMPCKRSPN